MAHTYRKIAILTAVVMIAAVGYAWYHPVCACALPPIPNFVAFNVATRLVDEGRYEPAVMAFDAVLHDPNSVSIASAALYGRGLSRRGLGDVAGGDADIRQATAAGHNGETQYNSFRHARQ